MPPRKARQRGGDYGGDKKSKLRDSLKSGDVSEVKRICDDDSSYLNDTIRDDGDDLTPAQILAKHFHNRSSDNKVAILDYLLDKGAKFDTDSPFTPLQYLCRNNSQKSTDKRQLDRSSVSAIFSLVKKGGNVCNINACERQRGTALHMLCEPDRIRDPDDVRKLMDAFQQAGAEGSPRCESNIAPPLVHACATAPSSISPLKIIIKEFVEDFRVNVNERDSNDETALHKLCAWKSSGSNPKSLIQMLLEKGADANLANKSNDRPYDIAKKNNNNQAIEALKGIGNSNRNSSSSSSNRNSSSSSNSYDNPISKIKAKAKDIQGYWEKIINIQAAMDQSDAAYRNMVSEFGRIEDCIKTIKDVFSKMSPMRQSAVPRAEIIACITLMERKDVWKDVFLQAPGYQTFGSAEAAAAAQDFKNALLQLIEWSKTSVFDQPRPGMGGPMMVPGGPGGIGMVPPMVPYGMLPPPNAFSSMPKPPVDPAEFPYTAEAMRPQGAVAAAPTTAVAPPKTVDTRKRAAFAAKVRVDAETIKLAVKHIENIANYDELVTSGKRFHVDNKVHVEVVNKLIAEIAKEMQKLYNLWPAMPIEVKMDVDSKGIDESLRLCLQLLQDVGKTEDLNSEKKNSEKKNSEKKNSEKKNSENDKNDKNDSKNDKNDSKNDKNDKNTKKNNSSSNAKRSDTWRKIYLDLNVSQVTENARQNAALLKTTIHKLIVWQGKWMGPAPQNAKNNAAAAAAPQAAPQAAKNNAAAAAAPQAAKNNAAVAAARQNARNNAAKQQVSPLQPNAANDSGKDRGYFQPPFNNYKKKPSVPLPPPPPSSKFKGDNNYQQQQQQQKSYDTNDNSQYSSRRFRSRERPPRQQQEQQEQQPPKQQYQPPKQEQQDQQYPPKQQQQPKYQQQQKQKQNYDDDDY
jgi:hypothetical protein